MRGKKGPLAYRGEFIPAGDGHCLTVGVRTVLGFGSAQLRKNGQLVIDLLLLINNHVR